MSQIAEKKELRDLPDEMLRGFFISLLFPDGDITSSPHDLCTATCFGLTSRRHWAMFRQLYPGKIPLLTAVPGGKWEWPFNPQCRSSLAHLLYSSMIDQYRPPVFRGLPYLSRSIYGDAAVSDGITICNDAESNWKARHALHSGLKFQNERFLPSPVHLGEKWYIEAACSLRDILPQVIVMLEDLAESADRKPSGSSSSILTHCLLQQYESEQIRGILFHDLRHLKQWVDQHVDSELEVKIKSKVDRCSSLRGLVNIVPFNGLMWTIYDIQMLEWFISKYNGQPAVDWFEKLGLGPYYEEAIPREKLARKQHGWDKVDEPIERKPVDKEELRRELRSEGYSEIEIEAMLMGLDLKPLLSKSMNS